MIRIFGRPLYWPGERALCARLDSALLLADGLRAERNRAVEAEVAALRQVSGLTAILQVARGDDFAPATGEGYQISPEHVLEYEEHRTGGRGVMREITASVKFALLTVQAKLYEAPWVEFGGLRWKLTRAQPLVESHHAYVIGRRDPEILSGRQWVEVQLVAYADGRR